jgi:hypothetical protein
LVKEKVMGLHQILLFITLIHLFLFSLSVLLPNYNVYFRFMDDLFFRFFTQKSLFDWITVVDRNEHSMLYEYMVEHMIWQTCWQLIGS